MNLHCMVDQQLVSYYTMTCTVVLCVPPGGPAAEPVGVQL